MGDDPTHPLNFPAEFVRHHRSLWLVAMSVVENAADADDTLQEAAIIGLRKSNTFEPGTNFRGWMGEIVRNVARNRRRKVRREVKRFGHSVDTEQLEVQEKDRTAGLARSDGQMAGLHEFVDDAMLRALMELDPVPRACVLLRCIDGLEYTEIAQLVNIPKGTVMSHVFRSRRVLAERLAGSKDRVGNA